MTSLDGKLGSRKTLTGSLREQKKLSGRMQTALGGVRYYEDLPDKPQINGVELSGNKTLDELNIQAKDQYASKENPGVVKIGENLEVDETGALNVLTTNDAEQDNTKPMTSAGVYTQLGNINILLQKI